MSAVEVREFRRSDRDALAGLVNAHVAAVVPGVVLSVNAVMNQLEREPGEFIVDPWVRERLTLVAEERGRVVAAALLLRYGDGPQVGESYRGVGEIRWFTYWPHVPVGNPHWPDATAAAGMLLAASVLQLERWGGRQYADGALPAPGVYGVPDQWPHLRALYEEGGFVHVGNTEIVLLGDVAFLESASSGQPDDRLVARRSVGINGTRIAAEMQGRQVGYIEVDVCDDHGRSQPRVGFADIGNLQLDDGPDRTSIAGWLLAEAAKWLRLAGVDRLLTYATDDEADEIAWFESKGFVQLTRTMRGWVRA